ncbi:hypothetical protein [Streptomyces sp. FXY-T5]|uniref:hypothetical protein n=1 Tax=Streptomyces sp. FXY-T5 TaxID=3064901 RepID=UPI0027D22168|nr:hypothetical protein [Streptomyces sp. FXY-T5]WMD08984.1 hypothetical protein Q7C01_33470 [Streptomyces sp. FXY-T5]
MDEQDCGDFLVSSRELASFEATIKTARNKVEVARVLQAHDLSEDDFTRSFPYLAKAVRDLPDIDAPEA